MTVSPTTALPTSGATRATATGLFAILLWGALALLAQIAGALPPFQLSAIGFAIGAITGLIWARATSQDLSVIPRIPASAWLLGLYGLLGYHAVYFLALKTAPPIEANLINYLWPLLIVVFAGTFPKLFKGTPLGPLQITGALLGFAGSALIVGKGATFEGALIGYLPAFAAAFIWSSYSVLSRLQADVPTVAVIGTCALASIGALIGHLIFETTVWPSSLGAWLAVIALGIGPMGYAFYAWDIGMKQGNITLLGAASFATPLLSTVILALGGRGTITPTIALAAVLITIGAVLAARRPKSENTL
jgi:drug/metabolite transporter (DMT)-like permease